MWNYANVLSIQEVEPCIGCMQVPASTKLVRLCQTEGKNGCFPVFFVLLYITGSFSYLYGYIWIWHACIKYTHMHFMTKVQIYQNLLSSSGCYWWLGFVHVRMSDVWLLNVILGTSECQTCFCRPMWCLSCLGRWFASRQDQQRPESWLSSRVPCPTCRAKFCILDICVVRWQDPHGHHWWNTSPSKSQCGRHCTLLLGTSRIIVHVGPNTWSHHFSSHYPKASEDELETKLLVDKLYYWLWIRPVQRYWNMLTSVHWHWILLNQRYNGHYVRYSASAPSYVSLVVINQ